MHIGEFARLGYLHAAALAAASCVNLSLHHHTHSALGKSRASHVVGFFERVRHLALGHGHAVLGQDCFCLIFVDFQGLQTSSNFQITTQIRG